MNRIKTFRSPSPRIGVVIRFKNSASTLPAVLDSLRRQTVLPGLILGIDTGSTDGSANLLRAFGATVVEWTEAYSHPCVLNFALERCPTDLVLILSSHTVLESADAIERYVDAMSDPDTACVSAKWDADPFYSDAIDWQEIKDRGLKFGSIYSNSMGMIRRSLWERIRFDESMPTMEDYAWALEQLRRGFRCRRLDVPFSYQRVGSAREFSFAVITFWLASRHGPRVTWLGVRSTLGSLSRCIAASLFKRADSVSSTIQIEAARLLARFLWPLIPRSGL